MSLTNKQIDVLYSLNRHVGETVEVATSQYFDKERKWNPVAVAAPTVFIGLQVRGYVEIVDTTWRAMTVRVLREYSELDNLTPKQMETLRLMAERQNSSSEDTVHYTRDYHLGSIRVLIRKNIVEVIKSDHYPINVPRADGRGCQSQWNLDTVYRVDPAIMRLLKERKFLI